MTELRNGVYATPTEELSALALEARRRGISYGHLVATPRPTNNRRLSGTTARRKPGTGGGKAPGGRDELCAEVPGGQMGRRVVGNQLFPSTP